MKKQILLIIFLSLLLISSCQKQNTTKVTPNSLDQVSEDFGISIGEKAPDFELKNYDGKAVKLSDFKGKPIVLDFFASWCPYCNNEMPRLQKIINEKHPNVKIIAIDAALEDSQTIEKWAKEKGFDFPLLVDESGKIKALYSIRGHPTTLYIDKDGIIRDKRYGSGTNDFIEQNIKKITA